MRNLENKIGLTSWRSENKFHSELQEELFIIDYFNSKKNGYVLDIGAADGITASNSFKIINEYEWSGLLIEACPKHNSNLKILYDDVDGVDYFLGAIDQNKKQITFYEVTERELGLSNTIGESHTRNQNFVTYEVPCLDINSILKKYNVPKDIDFVSLDIEGSEDQVLNNWNFEKYQVNLWCIEENNCSYEEFFNSHGYKRLPIPEKIMVCPYNHFYGK